jgi:small subunit ribosomal protein S2
MPNITLEDLLAAGAHFGHKVSRWNPKMAPYIFAVRNKFHIIDLEKTHEALVKAQNFVRDAVKSGGTVLFVGTKKQARDIVKKHSLACNMPFVVTRWLGGTLTNFKTIQRSIRKLAQLESLLAGPEVVKYTKKERLMMEREVAKNTLLFEGIRNLKRIPEVIFVFDTITDIIAVKEAKVCRVKLVGIVDTNADPKNIDYPIPCNDDALKALDIIGGAIAEAINEGRAGATAIPADSK